jgi:hypothetical protein
MSPSGPHPTRGCVGGTWTGWPVPGAPLIQIGADRDLERQLGIKARLDRVIGWLERAQPDVPS